jgi:hypothetical protein
MKKELPEFDEVCRGMCITFVKRITDNPDEVHVIESFIVQEALMYFSKIEEYEKCIIIQKWTKDHPEKIANVTRTQFFDGEHWETI